VDLKSFDAAQSDFDTAQRLQPPNYVSLGLLANKVSATATCCAPARGGWPWPKTRTVTCRLGSLDAAPTDKRQRER
jgi:hypothetical protein